MANYRRNEIVSGLFVLAAVVVFTLFAFRVGDLDLFAFARGESLLCRAYFDDVKTLDPGAKVTVAGRRVGSVRALRLVDQPPGEEEGLQVRPVVEVTFSLDNAELKFDAASAHVGLGQDGFLGRHFVVLDPGSWLSDAPPPTVAHRAAAAEDGEVLLLQGRAVAGWDAVVDATVPVVRRVDSLLRILEEDLLGPDGVQRVRGLVDGVRGLLTDARRLLDADEPTGLDQRVLRPLQDLVAEADTAVAQLRGRLLTETLPRAEQLLDEGRPVLGEARDLLAESRPRVTAMLDQLLAATRDLDGRLLALETDLHAVLQGAEGLMVDNRAELAETVRRLRRTVWQAEMALRKVRADPSVVLFGDDEADLEAAPQDPGPLWRGGRAEPYQQRDERAGGR